MSRWFVHLEVLSATCSPFLPRIPVSALSACGKTPPNKIYCLLRAAEDCMHDIWYAGFVHAHIYIYIYTRTCGNIFTYTHKLDTHTHIQIYIYIYICSHTYIYTYILICVYRRVYSFTPAKHPGGRTRTLQLFVHAAGCWQEPNPPWPHLGPDSFVKGFGSLETHLRKKTSSYMYMIYIYIHI